MVWLLEFRRVLFLSNENANGHRAQRQPRDQKPNRGSGEDRMGHRDRKSVVLGKSVDLGGRRIIKKKI